MDTKTMKYLCSNKWYHGTTLHGWKKLCELGVKVDYNIGNELDFGYGFYLTPVKEQAERYIENLLKYSANVALDIPVLENNSNKIPVVIEFSFCPYEWYSDNIYNFKFLNSYNKEFAEFVFHNRTANITGTHHHHFDLIFGVMSDNLPTILIQRFKNGEIGKDEVIRDLQKSTSNKQLSLHNQEICDIIKPTKVYCLETGKELDIDDYLNR